MAVVISGCATYQPVPEGYSGPKAVLVDSGKYEDGSKAQLFAAVEVDGNQIENSFGASAYASQGRGFSLTMAVTEREVPARPMKVTLRASHTTAAPIHAIASQLAGTFFSVEGTVDFEPKPNVRYVVRGELKKGASSVWIEEALSGQPVTRKVTE
ncbi:hypothetical protein ENE75_24435 [Rubrivivax albus]|uniref:Uncharacterized protein n=1 Tax=Rubrivivax albus TaxID=2499835 RepID=A0A3S3S710_9BURK|nr:hypothetical protein ENE75_24435 [Rubrivivax albus]